MVFRLFNLSRVMPGTIKELFLCWSLYNRRRSETIWEAIPLGVCWVIRRERNRRAFDNEEKPMSVLKNAILQLLFFWCIDVVGPLVNSFIDFVNDISTL